MSDITKFLEDLSKENVHFNRVTYDESVLDFNVWTSGYKTMECYDLEKRFMEHDFYAMTREFDRQCGKTRTYYKQVKKVS